MHLVRMEWPEGVVSIVQISGNHLSPYSLSSIERPLTDAQKLGRLLAIAAGHRQRLSHRLLLETIETDARERTHVQMVVVIGHADLVGNLRDVDVGRHRHDHHSLDHVEELTDVARPVVGDQSEHGRLREVRLRFALLAGVSTSRMIDQQRNILATLPQRRQMDLGAVDPEVEILAKLLGLDPMLEITVCRADEANIGMMLGVGTESDDLTRLQHAKQLGLHRQRHVPDLVQEQRALIGVFEHALAILLRAGEGALDMTEELILEQALALTGTVERDVSVVHALGLVVQGTGDEFLAGPGLAGDQHRDHAWTDLLNRLDHLSHGCRVTDDALEAERGIDLALQTDIAVAKSDRLDRSVDQIPEDLQIERFLDEVVGATLESRLGRAHIAMGRDHDDLRIGLMLACVPQHFESGVGLLHAQVRDDHIEAPKTELLLGGGDPVDDGAHVPQTPKLASAMTSA